MTTTKMKTAEDWLTDPKLKQRTSEQDVIGWIEAIQLDARNAALEEAAEIVNKTGLQYGDYDPDRDGRIVARIAIWTMGLD